MKAETKLRVAACAAGFALPRYNDLPSVGLYLDQTVQFVNGYFRSFCGVELTPSMVSNYVKKGVVDHPIRKKYTRDQIASLMYIAVSKTVLSIENIDTLFKMQREHCSAGTAYDIFCEELEASLSVVFGSKVCWPVKNAFGLTRTRMPLTKSCCCAAPFLQRSTKCIWTAASMPCGRSRLCGRISCRIWRDSTK